MEAEIQVLRTPCWALMGWGEPPRTLKAEEARRGQARVQGGDTLGADIYLYPGPRSPSITYKSWLCHWGAPCQEGVESETVCLLHLPLAPP